MQYLSTQAIAFVALSDAAFESLEGFSRWDHDCTFELSFNKKALTPISSNTDTLLPFEVSIDGRIYGLNDADAFFRNAATQSSSFGQYGVFFMGSHFERKDKHQSCEFPSSVILTHNQGKSEFEFTYRGSPSDGIPGIAQEAQFVIEQSGLAVPGSLNATWDSIRCALLSVTPESVDLLFRMMERLGSGDVFGHFWSASIMGVDEGNVNQHGFELYNRVAESGLTADEIKVLFKLRFLDTRGLEVVRQLCEGKTNYTIPLGTFRHRKKKAIFGVFTNKDGHRFSLTLKDTPTQEEWAYLESPLGTTFDRQPFA